MDYEKLRPGEMILIHMNKNSGRFFSYSDLCSELGLEKSTVKRNIDRFIWGGLVTDDLVKDKKTGRIRLMFKSLQK